MKLTDALKLRTPLVWISTVEISRGIDLALTEMVAISDEEETELYHVTGADGVKQYVNGEWTTYLHEQADGTDSPVNVSPLYGAERLLGALSLRKKSSIVLIPLGHELAKKAAPVIADLGRGFRKDFYRNKNYTGIRVIVVTNEEAIPPEIKAASCQIYLERPTKAELAEITTLFSVYLKTEIPDAEELVKAGIGMGEQEFIQACTNSYLEHGKLNAEFIEEERKNLIKHNTILELMKPRYTLDDIGGADNAKKMIKHMVNVKNKPDLAKELGIRPINKILLIGVPGTGKSKLCEATASGLGVDVAKFGMGRMFNKYIGESERIARESFKQLRAMAPILAWDDELGRDMSVGQYQGDAGTSARVQGEFLTQMQDLPEDVYFIGAANAVDGLSPEILRAGRFDKILFVGFPTLVERKEIFDIFLRDQRNDIDAQRLAELTSSFTGAEIEALIEDTIFTVSMEELRAITTEDIVARIPQQKNRMWIRHKEALIKMYIAAMNDWLWASSTQEAEAEVVVRSLKAGSSTIGTPKPAQIHKQESTFSL